MSTAVKCKRCLLSEIDANKYAETVEAYINALPESNKVDNDEYRRRIDICRSCDMLYEGMCRECGCYVEIRAVKKISHCPSVEHKW